MLRLNKYRLSEKYLITIPGHNDSVIPPWLAQYSNLLTINLIPPRYHGTKCTAEYSWSFLRKAKRTCCWWLCWLLGTWNWIQHYYDLTIGGGGARRQMTFRKRKLLTFQSTKKIMRFLEIKSYKLFSMLWHLCSIWKTYACIWEPSHSRPRLPCSASCQPSPPWRGSPCCRRTSQCPRPDGPCSGSFAQDIHSRWNLGKYSFLEKLFREKLISIVWCCAVEKQNRHCKQVINKPYVAQ